jgi:insertion element IS1 protein InsB
LLDSLLPGEVHVVIRRADEADMDDMWSYVQRKKAPRWLWHAIDHRSGTVLAYVFGRRKNAVFFKRKALLEPFGIRRYSTDYWGAYTRHLDADTHEPGKRNTAFQERAPGNLR